MRLGSAMRCVGWLVASCGAWAQGGPPPSLQAERARIDAERVRADQRFAAQEVACQQRFAVTDCVNEARSALRATHADLKRQEVLLNDGERRRKAGEQQRRLDEKLRQREADAGGQAARPEPAPKAAPTPSTRRPAEPKPRASHAQQTAEHEAQMRRKLGAHQADQARRAAQAASASEEERRYADKQRAAAEYKAQVLGRQTEPSKARPLPPPP